MVPKAKLAVACLILTSALTIQISEAANGGIATYWGQYTIESEGILAEACATNLYSYINIAYLDHFGAGVDLGLNLSGHYCDIICPIFIGEEIKYCQSQGVKILLSLGGPFGDYHLTTDGDAERVAEQLWNSVLGGNDTSYGTVRFFGDAVLDGIDFDIQHGSPRDYDELARQLKELSKQGNKTVYLSASPRCPYPDDYLGTAIDTGLFDFVWVKFYNNTSCQYNNDTAAGVVTLLYSWFKWDWSLKEGNKLFLGIPASNETDNSPLGGFIPADVLDTRVLPVIKETSKYGGVMVWNRYYDRKTNYSSSIINYVNSTTNNLPLPTLSMHASA